MKAVLVRIGSDMAYGKWNAPVDAETMRYVYVPIPESKALFREGMERNFAEFRPHLEDFCGGDSESRLKIPAALSQGALHLDPDFEHLTYGDDGSKRSVDAEGSCRARQKSSEDISPISARPDRWAKGLLTP